MPQTAQDAITTYVSDMLAVARHVAVPLEAQAKDDAVLAMPQAAALIQNIHQTINRQIDRLTAHLDQRGGNASSGIKNAVTSLLGGVAAAIDKSRKDHVSKMIRDDQTALALMTISYTMLHATALGLRDTETASLAERSLTELTPLVTELNKLVPSLVISELREQGLPVDEAAVRTSQETTQKAWN